jgi:purine-binding chemotaxis protein CheW
MTQLASETYVLFELAGTTYAVASASVEHIEMLEHVTLVPNAHPAVDGVVFSRGEVIPALNLRVRFGFPREPNGVRTRILFIRVERRTVGLIVDTAREFRAIASDSIRPIQNALAGTNCNFLKGLTNIAGRLVLLLDLEAILDLQNDASLAAGLSQINNSDVLKQAAQQP